MSEGSLNDWHTVGVPSKGWISTSFVTARVGRFELLRPIGKGGMGVVYEAIQDEPKRRVAVKLMDQAVLTVEQLKRFKRESELLGRLKHPNIAEVYDAGTHREGAMNIPYYAMELIDDAATITEFAESKELSRTDRIQLFILACRAVEHAHQHEVLHRDIKPSNLLVGKEGRLKLIDLGVSRVMSDASVALTMKDQMLGTVQYMSPEQIAGDASLPSTRWDVYALGVVLFELLIGRPPITINDPNPVRLANAVAKSDPIQPRRVDRTIGKDLEHVMLTAIHKDAKQRYANAGELADDLERVLNRQPIRARGDRISYLIGKRISRWVSLHPLLMSFAVLLAVTVGLEQFSGVVERSRFDRWWLSQLTTRLNYVPNQPFRNVQMVAMDRDLTDAAKAIGIGGYDPTNNVSGRLLHAAMLKRLAGAGARVVAFDIMFRNPSPFDDELVDAAIEAKRLGTEVVFALPTWTSNQVPQLISGLREGFRSGAALAHATEGDVWSLPAARIPEGELSLYAEVMAALRSIPPQPEITFGAKPTLVAAKGNGQRAELLQYSAVSDDESAPAPENEMQAQLCAQFFLELPPDQTLSDSIRDYADVLLMPHAELETLVRGKVVLLGDARPTKDGPFTTPDGRQLPGFITHGLAIESTVNGHIIQYLPSMIIGPMIVTTNSIYYLFAGIITLFAGLRIRSTPWRRATVGGTAAVVLILPAVSYSFGGWIFPIIEPLLAVTLCSAAAFVGKRVAAF